MSEERKLWFHKVNSRLWLPISWEGWLMYVGVIGGIFLVFYLNDVESRRSIFLGRDWPVLVEVGVLTIGFYWLSRGRVRK